MRPAPLLKRRQRHATRADIADIGRAHGEEAAVGVERKLDFGDEIAALIIAQESFRARRGEFHRPAELLRRPQHQAELDEDAVARAEIAADVVREDAQPVGRNAEHRGKLVLLPHRAAGAGIERVAAGRGIVMAERRARFERHAGDAADMEFLFHDMRRARQRLDRSPRHCRTAYRPRRCPALHPRRPARPAASRLRNAARRAALRIAPPPLRPHPSPAPWSRRPPWRRPRRRGALCPRATADADR